MASLALLRGRRFASSTGREAQTVRGASCVGTGMTRPFRTEGDPLPANPPAFPHKPPPNRPRRRKPKPV
jgi:hypothetical protein